MSNDDEPTGRDIRTIWKTVAVVGGILSAIGALLIVVISWGSGQQERNIRQDARIEALEKWQAGKDREASRELWRRDRERGAATPPNEPRKGGL